MPYAKIQRKKIYLSSYKIRFLKRVEYIEKSCQKKYGD